jgi:phosphohistidine swiveling domain-containing protein
VVRSHRIAGSVHVSGLSADAIGGKALALTRLERAGMPVPSWFCVTTAVFHDVTASLSDLVANDLAQLDPADAERAAAISRTVMHAIHDRGLSAQDRAAIAALLRDLLPDSPFVAVRSSAADEDSAAASFAGQMDSYLFVPHADVERRVLDCFASCFSPRALAYRRLHGRPAVTGAAVIVQRMIDSASSGVMFTANPTTGDTSETVVCAAIGVGEGVVADRAEADTFLIDSTSLAVRGRTVAQKRARVGFDAAHGAGTAVIDVAEGDAGRDALDAAQLTAVARLGQEIQGLFGCPQDVEWAFDAEGRLHVLQARPITTLSAERQTIFDNANIVESYPGLSLPLTFSFVRQGYERTFRAASRTLGVPESVLRENHAVHSNLVGLVNGSIYYNLLNWYRLFQFVPGFEGALPAWEQALGLRGIVPPRPPAPQTLVARAKARWRQVRVARRLLWHFLRLDAQVEDFRRTFEAVQTEFRSEPVAANDAHELFARFERIGDRLLERYAITVVNDAFVQQLYALLGRLMTRWNLGDTTRRNDLFAGGGVMESVRPVESLLTLAQQIRRDPELKNLFTSRPAEEVWHRLGDLRSGGFRAALQRHFDEYGDRTFQELKLETPLADEAPEMVIELLRNYVAAAEDGKTQATLESFSRSTDRRRAAELAIRGALSGHPLRRLIFSLALSRTRRMVAHREDMRLMRSRGFGMIKRIVREIGRRFTRAGLITRPHDVFYLSIEEVGAAIRGTSVTRDLRVLVEQRQVEYDRFRRWTPQSRVTARGVALASVAAGEAPTARVSGPGADTVSELRGIGCSAGLVRGRARVVRSPEQHLNINGEILVAPMTDPGWVFLMVAAGGLIVERGSILSHTAIIGRELGIPTVVGVQDATSLIADGQMLELDGAAGTIRILS